MAKFRPNFSQKDFKNSYFVGVYFSSSELDSHNLIVMQKLVSILLINLKLKWGLKVPRDGKTFFQLDI